MKQFSKLFFAAAVAALGLASCAKEVAPVETPKDNLVTVHFGATAGIEGATKATLTPNEQETLFTSAWEKGDALSVEYISPETADNKIITATWTGTSFEAKGLPNETGVWDYTACYPVPDSKDSHIDFGANRTQNGNSYNSIYDVMIGNKSTKNSAAGKDDDGSDIVFNMDRKTAVVYFHLTGGPADEDLVSATLSVEDGFIASQYTYISDFAFAPTEDLKEITITFPENAPKASDFQLWYNVLPTMYTKMTLTVETTGHTMTISRNAPEIDEYLAGKLYKVSKSTADKWVKKGGGDTPKPSVIEDVLTADKFTATETTYKAFTGVKATSSAVYAGSTAKTDKGAIQLRSSKNTAGIVTTTSGGSATRISVVWNEDTTKGTIDIYGKSTAYKAASDLYATQEGDPGTKIGSIICGTSTELVIEGDYPYIGIRSKSGTLYLNSITITWGNAKTALETPANLKISPEKVVSWNAVSGAASYEVTIGENTFTSETTSYDAAAIADDYYDVTVVAVPSDKDNYKNSAAATLIGAKFGTPKLTTPELAEGAIDETSIRVNMTVDARATNGCTCEIYNGETLVESKTIKVKYVVFSDLESGVAYTIKINAIAVDGEKPYAASDVASIELKTKPAQHVSDVTAAGTYTIKGLTVYAVANTSVAIAGDNTGYILVYKRSHGLDVGNTFDAAGKAELYNGVWELNSPSITNIKNGETPIYPNAVEATEDYLNAYASSQKIQYVHIKGTQTGKYIEVGGTKVFMETPNTEMEGKVVDAYGFVYGYHTTYNNAFFVVTSIKEDQTIPTLSVDQTSKVWAADATDAFVVNVTVNSEGGDWNVNPTALDWASITVNKTAGTITITPNGANTKETANEATLTITHASASLKKEITLKQNAAGGETAKTYTLQFGDPYNSADDKIGSYTKTWDATRDGFTWTMVNWNNNNNGWKNVRAGNKTAASVATITTKTTIPEAVSTVTMTIDAIVTTYVNSIKLEVLSADGNTVKETVSGTAKQGDCVFSISNPQQNCKYKITVDCKQSKSNGPVQVSKVVYTNN